MWAMVTKEVRQARRDRRTLAMMIVMPIMLLVVFGYAASFDVSTVEIAVPGGAPPQISALPDLFEVVPTDRTDPVEILRFGEADVAAEIQGGAVVAYIDGSQLFTARAAVQAFTAAAAGPLKGILAVSNEPLVSSDYNGDPHSSTVDALSTNVIDGTLVHVSSWYDNESGYSMRCVDLMEFVARSL